VKKHSNFYSIRLATRFGGWRFCIPTFFLLLVAPVAQAQWTPASLPSSELKNWYDASDTNTLWQDAGGTIHITANGQTVLRWNDKSGNGNHLTSSSGPAYTTGVMNSLPVVRFNGNLMANVAASMGNAADNFTVIGVFTVASNVGWDNWVDWGPSSGYSGQVFVTSGVRPSGPAQAMEFTFGSGTGEDTATAVTGQPAFIFEGSASQTTSLNAQASVWLNGTFQGATNPVAYAIPSGAITHINLGITGQTPHGDIAELLILNTGTNTLADADRQQIENYLLTKWWSATNNPVMPTFVRPPGNTLTPDLVAFPNPVMPLTAVGTNGVAFSYQIPATNNPTSFGATNLPLGLSVNPGTGLISGTPTNFGIYWSSVTASNRGGVASAQMVFVLAPASGSLLPTGNNSPLVVTNFGGNLTVQPVLDQTLLINPGKGFMEYWGPTTAYTPNITGVGYNRYGWRYFEPSEGVYDWSWIDWQISLYAPYGRKFSFGIINTDPGYTPDWVFQPGTNATTGSVYTNGAASTICTDGYRVPVPWDDPVYVSRMKEFIAAFGARYNGNTNIAFLDVLNYGRDGEGNGSYDTGLTNVSSDSLKTNFFKPYVDAFPNTQLLMLGMDWLYLDVFQYEVTQGVGRRIDGICWTVWNAPSCLVAYPHQPAALEYWESWSNTVAAGYGGSATLVNFVVGARTSYLQFVPEFYQANPGACQVIGNLIGYHFVLQQAVIPTNIQSGVAFPLNLTWLNDGVAPLYEPCSVALALLDTNNNVVQQQWLTNSNPQGWMPSVSTTESFTNLNFSSVPIGYKLAVGLFAKQTDANPTYRLGIQGRTVTGWYILSGGAAQSPARWTNLAGGSWQTNGNWTASSTHSGLDVAADFSTLNLTSNATVTLDGAVSVGNLIFGDTMPNYNWLLNNGTGGPLTLAASPSYVPSITVSNQTATINASLTGLQGLVKNGLGTLVLNGVNTFLGNTTISGGVLEVSVNSCLYYAWAGGAVTINPSGVLQLDGWYGYSGQTYGGDINQSDAGNPNMLVINGGILKFGGSWTGTSPRAFAIGPNGATLLNGSPNGSAWNFSLGGNSVQDTVINNSSLTLDGVGFSSLSKTLIGTGSLTKNGLGTWTLTGTNAYTGVTTIKSGCLALGSGGSISNTASISVAGGAMFDVSGLSSFTLIAGQTLSNSTSTATVAGNLNAGAGTVALTYAAGTPALQITNGTFTLSSNTVFSVNNTGTNLTPGSYKLIAKGTYGQVAGTVPATFSVGGGGAASGFALQIIGGELYLNNTNLWQPATLGTNLVNWYDASDITTLWQNTAGTTPVTASGQTVLRWNDKSGNGNHLTISSGGPAYTTGVMNALPVIYFNGNKLANTSVSMGSITNNFTVLGVIQVTSNSGWDNWIEWGNGNVGGGDMDVYMDSAARSGGANGSMEFAYNGGTGAYTAASVTGQPAFLFADGVNQTTSPSLFSIWKNGTAETSRNPTSVTTHSTSLTQFRIGPSGSSQLPHGNIAELIIVNTGTNTLSNGNRQQIEGYLANKWWGAGTNNPLPSSHPYKNSVPLVVPPTPLMPAQGVSVAGGVVSLTFPTVAGYQYRVDYKNALTDATWQVVAPGWVTSTNGANLTVTDGTAPAQGSRFYRVEAASP